MDILIVSLGRIVVDREFVVVLMQGMCCCKLMFFFRDCSVEDCFFANYHIQEFYGDIAVVDSRLCKKFAVAVFCRACAVTD